MRIGEATNKEDLLRALREATQRRLELRRGYEVTWWNNLAMVAGDHYAEYDVRRGIMVEASKESHKTRLALNQTLVIARTELAKIMRGKPQLEVVPNSNESIDIAATRVGAKVVDAMEWKHQLRKKRKAALWWALTTSTSATYIGWDAANTRDGKLKFVVDPRTGTPTSNARAIAEIRELAKEDPLLEIQEVDYPLGDIEYRTYSPFQLLPQEGKLEWADLKDLITIDVVNVDEIQAQYGKKVQPTPVPMGALERRIAQRVNSLSGMSTSGYAATDMVDGATRVYTYWLLPGLYSHNKFLRDGLMIRWVEQGANQRKGSLDLEFLESAPFVDDFRLPFVFYEHIPSATSIWSDSVVNQIRQPNLELDKTVSQLIENKDYMGNPMWRIPSQAQIKGKIKNQPGGMLIYKYMPNVPPPEPIPGVPMPAQVENLVVGLRDQMLDISGQGEVSRGRLPSGVRSAAQQSYLAEEDETKLAPTTESYEDACALMASMTLCRASQFMNTERVLKLYRRDMVWDVIRFKSADLAGNTDVMAVPGSGMPKNKAARQAFTMDLINAGVLTDPKRIEEMLELGGAEPDEYDIAFAQAHRENLKMLQAAVAGTPLAAPQEGGQAQIASSEAIPSQLPQQPQSPAVPVLKYHNHQVHLIVHYNFMNSYEFESLAEKNPAVVQLFQEHTTMHEAALFELQMQQMQMMATARGGPEAALDQGPGFNDPNQQDPNQPIQQ